MAPHPHHLVHSHAHEEDLPGTVNLQVAEGDDTAYGQALFPVPAEDPNDPLQWSNTKKSLILAVCSLYSFLGNSALLGPSVYISLYAELFGITPTKASDLVSYPNLAFGFGSLILVPLYLKIGRRPVMLGSMVLFAAGLIGASQATSFSGLMAARVIHGFGSGVCEALPVQLVNDIFFLHERGKRLGYYTVCLCLGSTGPLYAGYMLAGGYSWRLFFYVEFAFAMALLIAAFFIVEETSYKRNKTATPPISSANSDKGVQPTHEEVLPIVPPRKSYLSTLKPWSKIDHESEFWIMIPRCFTYFLVPQVLWVVTSFGIYIGLGALAFNYTFPIKITAPPYNWSPTNSGLITIASLLGYLLAIPFLTSSDRLAAHLTKKNNYVRESEMRLGVMLPAMIIAPCGIILYGLAAQHDLHWVSYFFAVGMDQWGSLFYFTFTLAYAVDSYQANTSEMLIAMNLGKQAISFGMGIYLLDWILQHGYAVTISGIFAAVLLLNNLALVIFMFKGKSIRIFMSKTWLARLHKRTIKTVGEVA
ncbi:major facilitator superfamily domain-containing protein [Clohesyomyces aquaticus]|uniref:Major facilitator superfamily domain-containing protein n=1 Tax=Clohesyomyces aquaticus TaxID=1231657 RepID=A0A1Y1ZN72_9PLEO|nr:major facilitator superfamily domain-containing protein [Clohesyomyces aquaticus]